MADVITRQVIVAAILSAAGGAITSAYLVNNIIIDLNFIIKAVVAAGIYVGIIALFLKVVLKEKM